LQTAAIGVPRITYDPADLSLSPGLLAEEARTNSIRNSTMQGASAPSTLPANWIGAGTVGTLTRQISNPFLVNGIHCIDVRYFGTTSSTGTGINFETGTVIAASSGQSWTRSVYASLVSGSLDGVSVLNQLIARDSSGIPVQFLNQGFAPDSALTRYVATSSPSNASTAFLTSGITLSFASGVSLDFTLRIGLPQLELGASASSPIPTSGAAATRAADNLSMTDLSWYQQSGGVLYIDFDMPNYLLGFFRYVLAISSNSTINAVSCAISANSQNAGLRVVTPSGVQAVLQNAKNLGQRTKFAARFQVNDAAVSFDGGPLLKDATVELPTGVTLLGIGNILGSGGYGGIIREIAFIPNTNISDSALQQLTRP